MMTNDSESSGNFADDIKKFSDIWDKVSDSFETEDPAISNAHSNVKPAGSQPIQPNHQQNQEILNENKKDLHWQEIYDLSQSIDSVFKKNLHETDVSAQNDLYALRSNPITTASKGKDQKSRVTPNFSDGDELRELNRIKIEMEALERKIHAAEIEEGNSEKLKKEFESLANRMETLSNSLVPNQEEDMT